MDLSELQDIDIGDLSTWPIWFRWGAIAILAVGILFAGYTYVISPKQQSIARLQGEEEELKQVFLAKKALVVNLPAYESQMVEIQDRFGVVLQQLPDKTEVPALLIDISQAGLSRGLEFEQFKPGKLVQKEFYATLPISVIVTGKYHQLAEFISDLAALPRIVTLGNMEIGKTEETVQMRAELFTYQYIDETQQGSAG